MEKLASVMALTLGLFGTVLDLAGSLFLGFLVLEYHVQTTLQPVQICEVFEIN